MTGRRSSSWFWGVLLVLVWGACLPDCGWGRSLPSGGKVVAVYDGDTIVLESGEKVRYLGIDAPETAHGENPADCHGDEAKTANSGWVHNKNVILGYDREIKDSHGRLLAYVFLPDGKCVNVELLKGGYASVFRSQEGFSRWKEFVGYQREALQNRRGMWGACSVKPAPSYVGNRKSFIFHRSDCPVGSQTARSNKVAFSTRWLSLEEGFSPCRRCKP